jgi:pimeloyl-ACP methyl ester carboxylesterase
MNSQRASHHVTTSTPSGIRARSQTLVPDPPPENERASEVVAAASTRMLELNPDPTFHYELLRILGSARDQGADVAEVLYAARRIFPGDFESWYRAFNDLAMLVREQALTAAANGRRSARGAFFRAATYFRAADFFLHGDALDPRMHDTWRLATACFDDAISRLARPAERLTLQADGFTIPAILYRPVGTRKARPTLLMCNGFDGSQEEMLHVSGFAALERGFNVLTFEGPGQPSVLRDQKLPFITEWEKVVTPLMNWCEASIDVDEYSVGLIGYSFGGFLAARAAAFEPRIAALACVDGIFDAHASFAGMLPRQFQELFHQGHEYAFDRAVRAAMMTNTGLRWAIEHGCWAFGCETPFEFFERSRDLTLEGVASRIRCPVLSCDAERDHTFQGQPLALAKALGPLATRRVFTTEEGADAHCHVGASDVMNGVVLDWFEDEIGLAL